MDSPSDRPVAPFWQLPLAELRQRLAVSGDGLSAGQAQHRLARYGPNVLQAKSRAAFVEFLLRFRNPLVVLLLVAALISAATGEAASAVIIVIMVLASVGLDFAQEYRAGRAAERLRQMVAMRVQVWRDGRAQDIPVARVVPGDVVLLQAGDQVPADARVLEAADFFVNQALITGEPYPVEKHALAEASPVGEAGAAPNAVFMGTLVISGQARVLVCATGAASFVGGIAETLAKTPPPTAFEIGTRRFGLLIMRLTLLLVLFVLLVNTFYHRPWLDTFLFAVALAVGLTPELLPMIVSVTLAHGAQRMARQGVIVKRQAAIHDLGSMDVLCTDKTGTLTEARIRLERHVDCLGRDSERVLWLAYVNSWFETGVKSPLDAAILAHQELDVSAWRKIDEVPFGFERRRVSVLVDDGSRRLLAVKGAPEDVLRACTQYEHDGPDDVRPLDAAVRARLDAQFEALSNDGFRVLGIAWRIVGQTHAHAVVDDESELVFAGFAGFFDPPKASAAAAMQALQQAQVQVKILTGDNEFVTRHLCAQLQIPVAGVLTGAELAQLDEPALIAQVERVNLFCRVSPVQKTRILDALRARGHAVGFLGDGINDAPSLHAADVGISVDGAVDVAKEAADLILLERDLGVLGAGVIEGRRTFGNIMKYVMMATSSNFGNMFSMAGAALFLPFLPLLPVQILLNNFLYDMSEVPLPMDTVDSDDTRQPRHWDMRFIRDFMWVVGPVSSAFDFLTFYVVLHWFQAGEALFRTAWFVESLTTQVLVIFIIRTRHAPLQSRPHPWLVIAALAIIFIAAALPFTALGQAYFSFVPLPAPMLLALAGLVLCYLAMVEMAKRRFYRHFG